MGNTGFDKQSAITDQRLRFRDVSNQANALNARVQAALALGSDPRCVTAYVDVMANLLPLNATIGAKADGAAIVPLEAVTVPPAFTTRVDVFDVVSAVAKWGHIEV